MSTSSPPQQIERYQRLIAISRDLASTLDLDLLLERIVNAAAELTNSEEASILLYDDRSSKLYFQAATNFDPRLRGLEIPAEKSLAGWIIQTGEPVCVADAQRDERHFSPASQVTGVTTHTLLGVPLRARQKIIGVLEAINKRQGEFTPDDQEILTTLGAHAAVAIENSRLFQQSDLIAEFIHEIRTPLAALQTAIHLLQRTGMEAERFERLAGQMQKEIQRLA
ncbi:MAG: GAF domain-containing protein, partial [Anaerolineae bacterium]